MNKLQNQKRINKAQTIFLNSKEPPNSEVIATSISILTEARNWSEKHNFIEDENSALWGLYLCYRRINCESEAINALQVIRKNLEGIRHRITNPMKRAGVFLDFPKLFGALCELLCRASRTEELLDVIEGAKGRVLGDVLTQKQGRIISDPVLAKSAQTLPQLMQQFNAHYLSYFVGQEATYAVFVAKDGSMHAQEISIGKNKIQECLEYKHLDHAPLDPQNWGKTIIRGRKVFNLSEKLTPLISWLETLASLGIIQQNDHICYCPDEELHLIPFQYFFFREKRLINYVSLSRIQGALALKILLQRETIRPNQFTVFQVWAKTDLGKEYSEQKLAAFRQAGEWLKDNLSGKLIAAENADLPTIAKSDLKQKIVHFSTHGDFPSLLEQEQDKKNPFLSSGLLLAKSGQLPPDGKISEEAGLLSPQQVLEQGLNFEGSHVTMQACVSGLALEGIGGDALGLEWTFMQNGASSLLSSHWNVDAVCAAQLSVKFYQKWLVEKASRAVAWRETVLELMEEFPDEPYYWAAFSLSGDWR